MTGRRRMRILVIEDIEMNRDLLVQLLEDAHDVTCEADGDAGLAAAERTVPDVVLLDLSLPKHDGWSVARALAAHPQRGAMTVIALTAHAMAGDEAKALGAGCDHHLTKPLDEAALFGLLDDADRRRAGRR